MGELGIAAAVVVKYDEVVKVGLKIVDVREKKEYVEKKVEEKGEDVETVEGEGIDMKQKEVKEEIENRKDNVDKSNKRRLSSEAYPQSKRRRIEETRAVVM